MVRASEREEFLHFVAERTPELFAVAYGIAGRQDAAERLLQSALERLALRWRRTDDPHRYAVSVMRRRQLPWWRRWPGARPAGGDADGSPATGGRPVDVGDLALYGARRRRLVRLASVVAVLAALAGGGVLLALPAGDRPGGAGPHDTVDLTGMNVVTSYYDGGYFVLNPQTGEYDFWTTEPGAVSPDLSLAASVSARDITIRSTTSGEVLHTARLPFAVIPTVAWSPDSRTVAMTPVGGDPDGYRTVLLMDAGGGGPTVVELAFPADRAGWFHPHTGAFWVDPDHLAVPTVDTTTPVLDHTEYPDLAAVGHRVVVSVTIVDRSGAAVEELPVDTEPTGIGTTWLPAGAVDDSRFLLVRMTGPQLLEVAAVDLADGATAEQGVQIPLPEAVAEHAQDGFGAYAWPSAWLSGDHVLVEIYSLLVQPSGLPTYGISAHQTLVVDLADGAVGVCAPPQAECAAAGLAAVLGTPLPVPDTALVLSIGAADALPAHAAGLGF